jgi:TANFOR domain-containing protein
MKNLKNAFILLFLLLFVSTVQSQNVTTTVSVIPPYSTKLTDYLDNPHRVTITFLYYTPISVTTVNVKLVASIKGDNGVEISTGDDPIVLTPITLTSGVPKTLTVADLKTHFNPNNLIYTGTTKNEILNLQGLPEGTYQMCAKVVLFDPGGDIPVNSVEACSNSFSVADVEAPTIITPTEGQEFSLTTPQNIVFSWTVPAGAPVLTKYKLRIVDVIPSTRNVNDAMNTAVYPYFFEQTTSSNAFVYGPAQPLLKEGHTYAFTVTAYDLLNKTNFKNNGVSEVGSFEILTSIYNNIQLLTNATDYFTEMPSFTMPAFLNPITATITGKLSYKYKEDGKTAPMKNIKVKLIDKLILKTADGNIYDVDPMYQTDLNVFQYPEITEYLARLRYYYSGNSGAWSYINGYWASGGPSQGTLTTGTTDVNGNFILSGTLPIIPGLSDITLGKIFENIQLNSSYITGVSMDAWGNYTSTSYQKYTGDLWRVWRVVVDNPYYYSPENDIVVTQSTTKDMGQLYCYVKTYQAKLQLIAGYGNNTYSFTNDNLVTALTPIPGGMLGYAYRKGALPDGFPGFEGDGGVEKYIEGQKAISLSGNDLSGYVNFKKLIWEMNVADNSILDKHYYYVTSNVLQDKNFKDAYGNFACYDLKKDFFTTKPEWYIMYNDQYKSITYTTQLPAIDPLPPMVSGKVIGAFQSPVKGATITIISPTIPGFVQKTTSDDNGYFEFTNLTPNAVYKIQIYKTGYKFDGYQEVFFGNPIKNGQRWYAPYTLQPLAQIHGFVKNESGSGVSCRICLGGATPEESQSEEAFTATFYFKNGHIIFNPTEFTVAVPKDKIHLLIDIDNESYQDIDTIIDVTKNLQEVGNIIARLRMRRLELTVNEKAYAQNLPVYTLVPLQNARVIIPGFSDTLYTNTKGKIFCKFLSSSASDNFQVLILGPKGKMYETKIVTLAIKNSGDYSSYSVTLKPATFIKGFVKVGNTPIAGATVRIDNGAVSTTTTSNYYLYAHLNAENYSNILNNADDNNLHIGNLNHQHNHANQVNSNILNGSSDNIYTPECSYYAVTAQDGSFTLMNVPQEKTLIIKASQLGSQYVGTIDTVYVPKDGLTNLILQLKVYNEMNITKIYGFPMAVENLTTTLGDIQITGYISKVKSNDQFQLSDPSQIFTFTKLSIIKGPIASGDTIPSAVPKLGYVKTNTAQCDFLAYNSFGGMIKNTGSALKIVEYTKADGNKAGGISGKVYLNAARFKISSLVIPSDIQLSLVKTDGSIQNDFNALNSDGSAIAQNVKGFKLGMNSGPVKLKMYDFPCTADNNSYLNNDSLSLNITLHTNFTNIKPKDWNVNIGQLILTPVSMSSYSGTKLDTLKMDKWGIASENWAIDNNGFHIYKGKLNMNGLVVPFAGMKVDTNTVTNATYELQNMKLLDMISVNLAPSATGFLSYDNTVKSWEMRITSNSGVCASVAGLPAFATNDLINFNIISLYSNGVQSYYGIDKNTPKLRIHSVLDYQPGQFFVGPGYIDIPGEFNLDIPDCKNKIDYKDEFGSELQYTKTGDTLHFAHKAFTFSFFSKGVTVEFPETEVQSIRPGKFFAKGTVKEDNLFNFKASILKTVDSTNLKVDPLGQVWNFSGGKSLKNVTGKMAVMNNNTEWSYFKYEGDVTESTFAGASGRMKFTVLGDLKVDDAGISLSAMDTPFGIGSMTYDFDQKALIGNLVIDRTYGPVHIIGDAQARFDASGWYFVGGGTLTMPGPISQLQAGILFADYAPSGSGEIKSKFAQYTYNGKMPEIFSNGIKGFYFCGSASLPVPILPSFDVDLIVCKGWFLPTYGGNFGFGGNFGPNGTTFQVDAKVFVALSLGFDLDLLVYEYGASAYAELFAFGSGSFNIDNGNFSITGGGGGLFKGNVHLWTIACLSACDIFNQDLNESLTIGATIKNPGGINFFIQY